MLVEKICEELGVEVGKRWKGNDGKFYSIEKDGSLSCYSCKKSKGLPYHDYIERALRGELKPYWELKEGDEYYVPHIHSNEEKRYTKYIWEEGCEVTEFHFENNLGFKTKEEAIEATNKILKALKE